MTDADHQLARSWDVNAGAWTNVVREGRIESRRVATDLAIVAAVTARAPHRVLDVGCGEGWLARALAHRGINVVGIDGAAALVQAARAGGSGTFHHITYDEFAARPQQTGAASYDVVVCNFALLAESIEPLLTACAAVLAPHGALLIQTVHPWSARGERYADGWRTESFASFGAEFASPMPWFFRTLSSWMMALRRAGLVVDELLEPSHPETGDPLSLLFCARVAAFAVRSPRDAGALK